MSQPLRKTLKGLRLYKADPIPGQKLSWSKVECTEMLLTQHELYIMMEKRADQISAAAQYQGLPNAPRMLINELVHQHNELESCGMELRIRQTV